MKHPPNLSVILGLISSGMSVDFDGNNPKISLGVPSSPEGLKCNVLWHGAFSSISQLTISLPPPAVGQYSGGAR